MNKREKTLRTKALNFIKESEEFGMKFPLSFWEAMKRRNVGRVLVGELIKLGVVLPEPVVSKPSECIELSYRARNVVYRAGLGTKEEVKQAILSKKLITGPIPRDYFGNPRDGYFNNRNYGTLTEAELCRWVGIVPPSKKPKRVCPHCGKEI